MAKPATPITLSSEEVQTLRHWMQAHKTEQSMAERARIVLLTAAGSASSAIAQQLKTPPSRVSKWRLCFAEQRLAGLIDRPRPRKPASYGEATRKRILTMLDKPPPEGHATWTSTLLAEPGREADDEALQAPETGWRMPFPGTDPSNWTGDTARTASATARCAQLTSYRQLSGNRSTGRADRGAGRS